MPGSNVYDFFLKHFRGLLDWLVLPFADENGSLETYSKRGYYFLGLILLLIIPGLWALGGLDFTVGELTGKYGLNLSEARFRGFGLSFLHPIPVALLPGLIYLYGLFRKRWREEIGKRFINFVVWFLDLMISLAETSLVHRTKSVLIFSGLIAIVTGCVIWERSLHNRTVLLEKNFSVWLENADEFVCHSTLTQFEEAEEYKARVQSAWDNDLTSISNAVARLELQKLLKLLYQNSQDNTSATTKHERWVKFLGDHQAEIEAIYTNRKQPKALSVEERRARILIHLLKGRILVQLSGECSDQANRVCPNLAKAKKHFDDVRKLNKQVPVDWKNRYDCAAENGIGTAYARAMKLYLDKDQIDLSAPAPHSDEETAEGKSAENLKLTLGPCSDASKCADEAYKMYRDSCPSFGGCDFETKRKRNNIADFLVKYSSVITLGVKMTPQNPELVELVQPRVLAEKLEEKVKDSILCSSDKPFVSAVFITAAEAYATRAYLRGDNTEEDLNAAFAYLGVSLTFNPANLDDWNWEPFDRALDIRQLETWLKKRTVKGLRQFSDDDRCRIIKLVKKQDVCRK